MESQYNVEDIQVLKGLEAVRKRPGMYIGSTSTNGLHHLVYEVVDNSIDEALAGYCKNIRVIIDKNDIIQVEDDGRGIPVGEHKEEGISALEVVMTKLHAGGKFENSAYKVSGGLHGVGVSVVNALSKKCEVYVHVDGNIHYQSYGRGVPEGVKEILGTTDKKGTIVRFEPDPDIFDDLVFHFDVLANRLRELAFLNKGVKITLEDLRKEEKKEKEFLFEGGVKEFVQYLNIGKTLLHEEVIYFETEKDDITIEVAIQFNDGYTENMFSFANNINTKEGGTHLSGFKTALTRSINDNFNKSNKFKKQWETNFSGDDVREGLTSVLSVKIPDPQFEGQTKTKLGNSEVRGIADSCTFEQLGYFFDENPRVIHSIIEKAILSAKTREAVRKAKDLARKKGMLDEAGLPGKLAECSIKDPVQREIYIVEGDSAGGSAKMGRDRRFQAILPLWGKMLNVEKARQDKVLANEKMQPIMAALGTYAGTDFDIERLRYHKVIIMADADVDGSHIRTLLLTFFFRYMQGLIQRGHVYLAMPPLYKITWGKNIEYVFSDEERDVIINNLEESSRKQVGIQRYKGLGEMNADELWETTMNPESRHMRVITMEDYVEADHMFTTLMGEEVPPRRQFIEENALKVANLDI